MAKHRWATTDPPSPLVRTRPFAAGPGEPTSSEIRSPPVRRRRWVAARGAALVFLGLALTVGVALFLGRGGGPPPAAISVPLEQPLPGTITTTAAAGTGPGDGDALAGPAPSEAGPSGGHPSAGEAGPRASGAPAGPTVQGAGRPAGVVFVHLTGAVAAPGVIEAPAGSRLFHVLKLAGGATKDADLAAVNLAAPAADGAHVHVPRAGEPAATPTVPEPAPAPVAGEQAPKGQGDSMVNLNSADAAELEALPRVGPVLAERIVAWREQHGPFQHPEDLDAVPGIGPGMLEAIMPLVVTG